MLVSYLVNIVLFTNSKIVFFNDIAGLGINRSTFTTRKFIKSSY